MHEEGGLNPSDFISFKTEIDLLCDEDLDIFKRWNILESIQRTKVEKYVRFIYKNGN